MPRTSTAKERLMAAMCELIWEHSYGATSVDLICARARVKKGSFYYFFRSKAGLAVAAVASAWRAKQARLAEVFSPAVPPMERLKRYTELLFETQTALKEKCGFVLGCPLSTLGSEVGTWEPAIRAKVTEILNETRQYLESAIGDAHARGDLAAPNPAFKSKLLFAYYQGLLTQARIENSLEPLGELYAGTLELLGARYSEKFLNSNKLSAVNVGNGFEESRV